MKMTALTLFMGLSIGASAQASVDVGVQVKQESAIVDGGKYILQSQASGTPYIIDAGTYYSVPNAGNKATTACVYYFYKNTDGTWRIKNQYTGKYWGAPVQATNLMPSVESEAGAWTLNISDGIAYPKAKTADGKTTLSIDRSSQILVGYTTGTSVAQRMKIFEVDSPLSSEALPELEGKTVTVGTTAVDDIELNKWYVMFDRGINEGRAHGYLFENPNTHLLYNTATRPEGMANSVAHYLVRLSDAGDGKYYVQNGLGNYFGAFVNKEIVGVVPDASEAITIEKIAGTDAHYYLQCVSTGVVLDANDLWQDPSTIVGWSTTAPTSIEGNNDWAFYPVTLEEIPAEIVLFDDDVEVTRGYQTTGRGNADALLLRIDVNPSQALQKATFRIALDEATRNNISSLYIYETKATEFLANIPEAPLVINDEMAENVNLTVENITAGLHRFWLCATVKGDAELGTILKASLTAIDYTSSADASYDATTIGNPARQGMKVFDQQMFVFKPTTDNCRYYRIPAMILDKDGNIVIAIDKRYNSNSDLGNHKIDVVSKRSEDGGRTWQDFTTVAVGDGSTAAYYGYGDAALACAANGDLVCIMASGSKTWGYGMVTAGLAKSTDNGKSWTLVKNLLDSPAFYDENSEDGNLSVANIFTTSGKGLTTTDGVIMFTTNCKGSTALCYILYSTDNGAHWRLSNAVAYSGCDESKLEQLNDGSLLLSVRQSGKRGWNTATYTKNNDGTVTFKWGSQKRTDDIWGNACNADILYYSRESDTTPDIMLHSFINTSGRESLQLSMSLNGGDNWTDVYNIQPNGSCYSTMIQLPNGNVAILYEDESYSAGNGYAINFLTITREQILDWFQKIGGVLPTGIGLTPSPSPKGEGSIYSISGQRLSRPQRGVNIVNGKKVVVK